MSPRHKRLATIGRVLFGLVNVGAGLFFLFLEMKQADSHSLHVSLFVGWVAVGWVTIAPSLLVSSIKQILALVPPIKIGGKGE